MALADLVDEIAMDIPAPRATIKDVISRASREFCREADVWVIRSGPVVVAADTDYAELSSGEGEPLRIVSLKTDDRPLVLGVDYEQVSPTQVKFMADIKTSVVYGDIACRPAPKRQLPDDLVTYWHEALGHGARKILYLLPQQWRNPDLYSHHEQRFSAAISQARNNAAMGYAKGARRVKQRPFI
jgi:hypothetical protein